MIKILKIICIFQMFLSVTFGDSSNYESSVCEAQDPARDVAFVRIGRYRGFTDKGSEYQKTYLLSKYLRTDWFNAKLVCKSFDLELASFETLTEAENFLYIAKNHPVVYALWATYIYVDGMSPSGNTSTDWYWTNTGTKVSYPIPWQNGGPDFFNGIEYCLSFTGNEPSHVGFNDIPCSGLPLPFVCQRIDYFIPARAN